MKSDRYEGHSFIVPKPSRSAQEYYRLHPMPLPPNYYLRAAGICFTIVLSLIIYYTIY